MLKSIKKNSNYLGIVLGAITSYLIATRTIVEKSPVLRIRNGDVQGIVSLSRSGREYHQFLGIPYAEPPLGALRFEPPKPAFNWNGTLDASSYGPACIGYDFIVTGNSEGEEDCLTLNVMTPNIPSERKHEKGLYPVVVFIYGGSFQGGESHFYPGKYFMDEDVVFVTVNYRIGIFGFFSTYDEVIPGNMGMKDQVLALKWVQENIKSFGGDPNQVTIMGESAGGTSTHYLMLSPLAKNLFHRTISMSCTALFEVFQANTQNITEKAEHAAKLFDCPHGSSQELAECLRGKSAETLATHRIARNDIKYFNHMAEFGPVKEMDLPGAFLPELPLKLLQDGSIASKVPWMVGVNDNEGLLLAGKALQFSENVALFKDVKLWNELLPHILFYDPALHPDAATKIKVHFLGKNTHDFAMTDPKGVEVVSRIVSEKLFVKGVLDTVQLHSRATSSHVYLYHYSYKSFMTTFNMVRWAEQDSVVPAPLVVGYRLLLDLFKRLLCPYRSHHYGTSHGDELPLLFDIARPVEFVTDLWDLEMSRLLVKTIADFAHVKKPVQFQGLDWPQVEPSKSLKFMNLNIGDPVVLDDLYREQMQFWNELNLTRV